MADLLPFRTWEIILISTAWQLYFQQFTHLNGFWSYNNDELRMFKVLKFFFFFLILYIFNCIWVPHLAWHLIQKKLPRSANNTSCQNRQAPQIASGKLGIGIVNKVWIEGKRIIFNWNWSAIAWYTFRFRSYFHSRFQRTFLTPAISTVKMVPSCSLPKCKAE